MIYRVNHGGEWRYQKNIKYVGREIINLFLEEMNVNQSIGFFDEKNDYTIDRYLFCMHNISL